MQHESQSLLVIITDRLVTFKFSDLQ